jgi:hypothetical protein
MVGLAFAAVLVRETALAWLAAIALYGLWQRDWRRAGRMERPSVASPLGSG